MLPYRCAALLFALSLPRELFAWPTFEVTSSFSVYDVDSDECGVPSAIAASMRENGFVKIACPFGVLIGATENYRDEYILYGANVLANILDQDADGVADDPAVVAQLTYRDGNRGAMLMCGTSREEEEKEGNIDGFDYIFSCQTWYFKDDTDDWAASLKGTMQEEAFHMCHQNGFAKVYPAQLGLDDFTSSVACRETARLQCVSPGWWHPENTCPADSPRSPSDPASSPLEPGDGDCTEASCDCAEFYKQALFLAIGASQDDGNDADMWFSDYMPRTQAAALEMLSIEFKDMIANTTLHQLRAPISGEYGPTSQPTSEPAENSTTSDSGSASVSTIIANCLLLCMLMWYV